MAAQNSRVKEHRKGRVKGRACNQPLPHCAAAPCCKAGCACRWQKTVERCLHDGAFTTFPDSSCAVNSTRCACAWLAGIRAGGNCLCRLPGLHGKPSGYRQKPQRFMRPSTYRCGGSAGWAFCLCVQRLRVRHVACFALRMRPSCFPFNCKTMNPLASTNA